MMVQTWPGGEKSLHHAVRRRKQRFHRGRNQHVRHQQREIFDAVVIGLPRRHGVGGSRGFESDGKEHDLPLRDWSCASFRASSGE